MKAPREQERAERRRQSREILERALNVGDRRAAWEYANKCVDVTPEMVHQLILELTAANIRYVVAPYEADAQMAYLNINGIVDAVITEDSDMVLFGCTNVRT